MGAQTGGGVGQGVCGRGGLFVGQGVGVGKYVSGGVVGAAVGCAGGVGVAIGVETGVGVLGANSCALVLTERKNGAANAVPIRNLMKRRREAGILDRSASNFSGPLSVAISFSFVWSTPHPDETFSGCVLEEF